MTDFNNRFKELEITRENFHILWKQYEVECRCPNCGQTNMLCNIPFFYCKSCKWLNPCDSILRSNDINIITFRIDKLYEQNADIELINTIINEIVKIDKDSLTKSAYRIRKQLFEKAYKKQTKSKPSEVQQSLF